MWGYIDDYLQPLLLSCVPSLYVRVYRRAGSSRTKQSSSLIICEGISTRFFFCEMMRRFPHYMWGYIAISGILFLQSSVPSLYVRVYHWHHIVLPHCVCSLIICEGISPKSRYNNRKQTFPHYMWGYIVLRTQNAPFMKVPSLYVRVYHQHGKLLKSLKCSLIICEGISSWHSGNFTSPKFPHYMWVYIEIGDVILQASKNINVVDDGIPQIA